MLISLNWLRDFIHIPLDLSPQKIGDLLTKHTAEVEQIIDQGKTFEKMVIGRIEKISAHPNADKLKICLVDLGQKKSQIICGGNNLAENMLVPVALPEARVRWHGQGELVTLEKTKIRGMESEGMICAGEEIGLEAAPLGGITDLTHTQAPPGTPLNKALDLDDVIFEIENKSITHRPDLWGHYGIARELATILNVKLKPLKINKIPHPLPAFKEKLSIEIQSRDLCPRYMGTIIKNIKISDSPLWLKKRLETIGVRSICNVVDITNYISAELGHPLHAFDQSLIAQGIIVRNAHEGEEIITLDGQKRTLTKAMLLIADHQKPLAIAGVMGAENSQINQNTTSVILEAATFNKLNIRRTALSLGIRSEAVSRYEKGIDPHLTEIALNQALKLILKICPSAQISSEIVDIKNFSPRDMEITLDAARVQSKLGLKISPLEIKSILSSLEFRVKKSKKDVFSVTVPTFRAQGDIETEDDLIEEIGRIYGYDQIKPELPPLPIKLPRENKERSLKHAARAILSFELGFNEIYTYSFYSLKDCQNCLLSEENHLKISNFLSADQTHLRASLLPNILKALKANFHQSEPLKFYEFGRVYQNQGNYWPKEEKKILAAIATSESNGKEIFFSAKGALEAFLSQFNFENRFVFQKSPSLPPPFAHPGKHLEVFIDSQKVGQLYELNPKVGANFNLDPKIALFELNFALIKNHPHPKNEEGIAYLSQLPQNHKIFKPLPKFPSNTFDVSVTIGKKFLYSEIITEIKKAAPELINEIELFDIYTGSQIALNKKNLAFRIMLQAKDHTVSDQEMSQIQQKVFQNLQSIGGEIRGLKKNI